MIYETYLSNLKRSNIPLEQHIIVCRGRGNDELAPSERLLNEFLKLKYKYELTYGKGSAEAHNKAWDDCKYEEKFRIEMTNNKSVARLQQIKERSIKEDVWLVCYEGPTKKCHRFILIDIINKLTDK